MGEQAEALSERIFSLIGTAELLEVYLGTGSASTETPDPADRWGLLAVLSADLGPVAATG